MIVVRTGFIGFSSNLLFDGDFITVDGICFFNVGDNFDCCSLLKWRNKDFFSFLETKNLKKKKTTEKKLED